jgi:glycosyltransferase involved in cell wall biosynthesis
LVTIGPPLNIPETRLPCKIIQLGVQNTEADLVESYRAADVLLLPSLEDNSPLMALGAMACGTPVIAFDVGGIPELLADSGLVCPLGDWNAYFKRIIELTVDQRLLIEKQHQAHEVFLAQHQTPSQASACLTFYKERSHDKPQMPDSGDFYPMLAEFHESLFHSVGENLLQLEKKCRKLIGGISWRDNLSFWQQPATCISRIIAMLKRI